MIICFLLVIRWWKFLYHLAKVVVNTFSLVYLKKHGGKRKHRKNIFFSIFSSMLILNFYVYLISPKHDNSDCVGVCVRIWLYFVWMYLELESRVANRSSQSRKSLWLCAGDLRHGQIIKSVCLRMIKQRNEFFFLEHIL